MIKINAEYYINKLDLEKHPEGGYFKEIYRGTDEIVINKKIRNIGTSIYFLLKSYDVSRFHRLKSDELWYYHKGSPITIYIIDNNGVLNSYKLGINIDKEEYPQIIVKKGSIFGAKVNESDSFSLMGCAVFPGFDFKDFELLKRNYLLEKYPIYEKIIKKLT